MKKEEINPECGTFYETSIMKEKKKYKEINLDEQRIKGHKKKVLYVPRFFFF